jgi:hypothetical protein
MTEALRQALEAFGERLGRQQVVCLASPGDEVAVGGADWVFVKAATVVVLVGDHPPGTLGEGARVDFWVRPGPEQAQIRDLSLPYLDLLRQRIAGMAGRREALKMDMEAWFDQNPQKVFPRMAELADVDARLSHLDSCFKRQWDARYGK